MNYPLPNSSTSLKFSMELKGKRIILSENCTLYRESACSSYNLQVSIVDLLHILAAVEEAKPLLSKLALSGAFIYTDTTIVLRQETNEPLNWQQELVNFINEHISIFRNTKLYMNDVVYSVAVEFLFLKQKPQIDQNFTKCIFLLSYCILN